MTQLTAVSSTGIVKKAVGAFVAQKYLTMAAAGVFSNVKTNPRQKKQDSPRTSLSNRSGKPKDVPLMAASPPRPRLSWKKRAAIATGTAMTLIYVVYPTSLLLAFRVSEQISWIRLFQNFHNCRLGKFAGCAKVGMVQISQVLSSVGSIAYFWQLAKGKLPFAKSIWKGILWYALFWMLLVAVMKISVDELALYKPKDEESAALAGKVAVITGANRGIGLATAQWMALHGAHVVLTCRTLKKCQPVVDQINQLLELQSTFRAKGSASAAVLDLSSLQSANDLVDTISKNCPNGIHYLFCNAGTTPQHSLTKEGLEDGFGGMHLAHMAVALGLLPVLKKGADNTQQESRIVMVASEMSINAAMGVFGALEDMFDANNLRGERIRGDGSLAASLPAYGRAKLCNVLLALELNRQLNALEWPVIAHAVHTGAVVTDSSRNSIKKTFEGIFPGLSWMVGHVYFPMLWRNVEGGARTLLCAALSGQDFVVKGGQYLDALCRPFLPETTTERDTTREMIIPFPLGRGNSLHISLDAVQALLLADSNHSKFLWNVSMGILKNSPAHSVVNFEGNKPIDQEKAPESPKENATA
jgi:NAD(P)-dependent dehydrogenase (short-subunit alcohol dehydrogenase family)